MTTNQPFTASLGDLKRMSTALATVVDLTDALRSELFRSDERWFARGSPASSDAQVPGANDYIEDLLGAVNIRLAAALELADFLAKAGIAAANGAPTPIYVPLITARSAVEICGMVAHLTEPGLPSKERIGRILTLQRSEQIGVGKLGQDTERRLAEIDNDATALGLKKVGSRNARGYGGENPSYTKLVTRLLRVDWFYSLMSGVSHGEAPAIIIFGYEETEEYDDVGPLLMKKPPVNGLALVVTQTIRALSISSWMDMTYRSWPADSYRSAVEAALSTNGLQPPFVGWPGV